MKKPQRSFLLALCLCFLLSNCTIIRSLRTYQHLRSGERPQTNFLVEIPFEERNNMVIISAKIQGKSYDFLWDTGAPNVLSKELYEQLDLKKGFAQDVEDSQGDTEKMRILKIPSVQIGGINFENTAAIVTDLKANPSITCLEIDGIIGSNLMRLAIWQINPAQKIIKITDDFATLKVDEAKVGKMHFFANLQGVPNTVVDLAADNLTSREHGVTIDWGYAGDFDLNRSTLQKVKTPSLPQVSSFGATSSGLFNRLSFDTVEYARIPTVDINGFKLENTVIEFTSEKVSSTIGTDFFKHFIATIDWNQEIIFLEEQSPFEKEQFIGFGLYPRIRGEQMIVSEIFEGSQPALAGIQPGDQIISYNGQSVEKISPAFWCDFLNQPNGDTIQINILHQDSIKSLSLYRKELIQIKTDE